MNANQTCTMTLVSVVRVSSIRPLRFLVLLLFAILFVASSAMLHAVDAEVASPASDQKNGQATAAGSVEAESEEQVIEPWDFSPYRVLIWIASDDASVDASSVANSLSQYLDRDFSSIWRISIEDAPSAVAIAAQRDLAGVDFETIAAGDAVVAVKKNHPDAIRIRSVESAGSYVSRIFATQNGASQVQNQNVPQLESVKGRLIPISGDAMELQSRWKLPDTEAILTTRGMALTLTEPVAKLIDLPVEGRVSKAVDQYDKVFIVRVQKNVTPYQISAVEFDTLMQYFGPVANGSAGIQSEIITTIGRTITTAFAPTVRIENAGQDSAQGLLRAGGLILDENSPGLTNVSDVLIPMVRKNDRNGKPILIGPLDWSFLLVKSVDGVRSEMDYHSGRPGGLQGRNNQRTFRMALRIRKQGESTELRLHARGDKTAPLIGYEIYERELESPKMTFVGRTDWNGRIDVEPNENPMRLFYVKNGGAVLARLPMVPGLTPNEVADLGSDDMRLQAEAYIRGVQNAIIDLVAIRELFAARVRLRLEKGQMKEAEELLNALRSQPTNEKIANDMGKKETEYLKIIGPKNPNEYRKVENLFSSTREMLAKHINPKIINDLEADVIAAERNGGKLPKRVKEAVVDNSAAPKPKGKPKNAGNAK